MKKRPIIEFATPVGSNYYPVIIKGYQLKHGLALSHPVKIDNESFCYDAGWVVYRAATGRLVRSDRDTSKTPLAALLSAKNIGGVYRKLNAATFEPYAPESEPASIIGKLRALPKPKADKVHRLNPVRYSALIRLVADIDAARNKAYRTSEMYLAFTFGKASFKVGARLEALNRFRERVLKNKLAFSNAALNA